MSNTKISSTAFHAIPADLRREIAASAKMREAWNDITPLARNEWVCWITSVKKNETRKNHLERVKNDLIKGKRRPCCFPGCPHRKGK